MWNWSESHLSNGWWDSNEFKWNIRINSIFELRASSGISFQGWFKQWSWVATVVPNQANLNHASEQFTYHQYHAKKHKKLHFWPQKLPPTPQSSSRIINIMQKNIRNYKNYHQQCVNHPIFKLCGFALIVSEWMTPELVAVLQQWITLIWLWFVWGQLLK